MKYFRGIAVVATLVLAFVVPTKSYAYKYYIHYKNGEVRMFEASSREEARELFRSMCLERTEMEDSYLTSRPNGGFMESENV